MHLTAWVFYAVRTQEYFAFSTEDSIRVGQVTLRGYGGGGFVILEYSREWGIVGHVVCLVE